MFFCQVQIFLGCQSSLEFSSIFLTSKNVQALANLHIFCHPGMTRTLLLQDRGTRACFHDARVCTQLFCYSPDYAGCAAYRPAAEGSACGGGGVCREGSCVYTSTPTRVSTTRVSSPSVSRPRVSNTRVTSAPRSTCVDRQRGGLSCHAIYSRWAVTRVTAALQHVCTVYSDTCTRVYCVGTGTSTAAPAPAYRRAAAHPTGDTALPGHWPGDGAEGSSCISLIV